MRAMSSLAPLPGHFSTLIAPLTDPRVERTRRYSLIEVLFEAFCAVLSGCNGWDAIAAFADDQADWFAQFFPLAQTTPCADTFRRVFERLDPAVLEASFGAWVTALGSQLTGQHVAFDGKAIRGAFDRARPTEPLYFLHVWAVEAQRLLGFTAIAGAPGEPAGAAQVLGSLHLAGATVTADANGCTQALARQIHEQAASYCLALKGNRGPIYHATCTLFDQAKSDDFAWATVTTHDKGHGRREQRTVQGLSAERLPTPLRQKWAGLQTLLRVTRQRHTATGTMCETAYYLSSLPPDPLRLEALVRGHWGIENGLHHVLDVSFGEDRCRIRDCTAAANLATLRRVALTLLQHPNAGRTRSIVMKQRKAGWNGAYRLQLLQLGSTSSPEKQDN
jgi:predicted transposase YbfD/YdcC